MRTNPAHVTGGSLPATADVVIVGAGIAGITTAWFLAGKGVQPVVVDAGPALATRTTAMSAHCIRAQFSEPDSIAMMSESLSFYEQFAERLGMPRSASPIGLQQPGYLFASTDPGDIPGFSARVEAQRALGLTDVELLDGEEVRQRYPWLARNIVVATYRARDGWIDSGAAVQAMANHAGCPIYLDVDVERIEIEHGRVVGLTTSAGPIRTGTVILAAGPFSASLSPEPLPLHVLRRHRLIVPPTPGIPQDGPVTIDANTGAHWRPHLGGALMAWAQAEAPGEPVWPVPADPGFVDLVLWSRDGVGRLAPFWHELHPSLEPARFILTAGQYTMTPDHRPLIGPAPQTVGLYLNTGYSGHGIMGAPAGGRLLADIVTSQSASANRFSPARRFDDNAHHRTERMVI